MKALANNLYLIIYVFSNVFALALLISAWKQPRLARFLFLLLFASAGCFNFKFALRTPEIYLDFDELTIVPLYKSFISGWFRQHIELVVIFIAGCQGLIAVSLALKGWIYRVGLTGGIIFLVSIAPFGVGSAFPCTLILAIALIILWKQHVLLWKLPRHDTLHNPRPALAIK